MDDTEVTFVTGVAMVEMSVIDETTMIAIVTVIVTVMATVVMSVTGETTAAETREGTGGPDQDLTEGTIPEMTDMTGKAKAVVRAMTGETKFTVVPCLRCQGEICPAILHGQERAQKWHRTPFRRWYQRCHHHLLDCHQMPWTKL